MQIPFTKMHGAGNDFVVLDETAGAFGLSAAQYRFLANRHLGVGADQVLGVRAASVAGVDFDYVIHNADGSQVAQCGNGARCFARYVHDRGLTDKRLIRVQTLAGVIAPELHVDGRVTVDMGAPILDAARLPFDTIGLTANHSGAGSMPLWPLDIGPGQKTVWIAAVSMGNPHAVLSVDDVDSAPVAQWGPLLGHHPRFAQQANVGFMQVLDRSQIRLRVHERGAGETLSCGSGACAAVIAGVLLGLLDARTPVRVHTKGGRLDISWHGNMQNSVYLTGPTAFVFDGKIRIPEVD